jgi:hypothetical protein
MQDSTSEGLAVSRARIGRCVVSTVKCNTYAAS